MLKANAHQGGSSPHSIQRHCLLPLVRLVPQAQPRAMEGCVPCSRHTIGLDLCPDVSAGVGSERVMSAEELSLQAHARFCNGPPTTAGGPEFHMTGLCELAALARTPKALK